MICRTLFVFLYRSHWFLAVICFPYLNLSPEMYDAFVPESSSKNGDVDILDNGDTDDDDEADVVKKSCILIFDSMKKYTTDHTLVYRTLWNFLTTECRVSSVCIISFYLAPNLCIRRRLYYCLYRYCDFRERMI